MVDTPPPPNAIENLVFEGGGVHGIAYVGALQALHDLGLIGGENGHLCRVGGTSIGALIAVGVALGLTPDEMHDDFSTLTADVILPPRCFVALGANFVSKWGLRSTTRLRRWIDAWLSRRCSESSRVTFASVFEASGFDLHIAVYNCSKGRDEIIDRHTHPDTPVAAVLTAAMAVPGIFQPVRIPPLTNDLYIDGGMTNNFPIYIFDDDEHGGVGEYNEKTLGLRSVSNKSLYFAADTEGVDVRPPHSLVDYYERLVQVLMTSSQQRYEQPRDAVRTVFIVIPEEIPSLEFNISERDRDTLYQLGYSKIQRRFASL